MANYVYVVTEKTFTEDGEYNIIGAVCYDKKDAVYAVNLAMSQIENKSKHIYTKKSWYRDDACNWCKSTDYRLADGEDYYTRLTIAKKEVI